MGYNMKLVGKQNNQQRFTEIREIESISNELSKNDIGIANQALQKAIIYDNERDTTKRQAKKTVEGEVIVEDPNEEFEVKYPGIGVQLLVNPFAKVEKAGKKKKKK